MPHAKTGIVPAELIFSRKIRTRLDIMKSDDSNNNASENDDKKCIFFSVGGSVYARNYNNKIKWQKGKVAKVAGKLHYLVKLPDGKV